MFRDQPPGEWIHGHDTKAEFVSCLDALPAVWEVEDVDTKQDTFKFLPAEYVLNLRARQMRGDYYIVDQTLVPALQESLVLATFLHRQFILIHPADAPDVIEIDLVHIQTSDRLLNCPACLVSRIN